ncbi:MAG TPA: hypothetical protein ENG67_02420, partial [candidate division WOR-3 bacterium]|nr:hypothetical protein [candidate division WOR-3 bacterium]
MKKPIFFIALLPLITLISCHEKGLLTPPYAVTGYTPVIGYARDVWVEGNMAYVAASEGGISIFDVADPDAPLFISRWDDTLKQYVARSLFKEEDSPYLYLADDDGGLEMLNVSQVDSIYFLYNSWNRNCEDVWGTKLNDTLFLFVADRDDGLYSFREGPNYLVELSHISTEAELYGVFVRDTLAYLAVGELGLEIVDISDPLHMTRVATLPLAGRARDVKVMGDLAFVASSTDGLHIISVSDPSSPV